MGSVEEYSDYPLTMTRMIAWDSPSTWGHAFVTKSTFQPLTESNLAAHVKAQPSSFDPKNEILERYYFSMKNYYSTDSMRSSPKPTGNTNLKKRNRQTTTTTGTARTITSATAKSVAIDVHPLPFPYHNDNTFLPTVETGRTRFDSESTQYLYDNQPPSPTHTHHHRHLYSKQSNYASSRITGSCHRHRRDSRTSHYSSFTAITDTTNSTGTTNTNNTLRTQQSSKQHRFQTTKTQLSALINRNRFSTSGTQHRLSTLLTRKRTCPASFGSVTQSTGRRKDLDQQFSAKPQNGVHVTQHGHRRRPSSLLISPEAYYNYCQGKPIVAPSPNQQNYHAYPVSSEKTPCGTTTTTSNVFATILPHTTPNKGTACAAGTVSSSSSYSNYLHNPSFWKTQMAYVSTPSNQYTNKTTSCYSPPPQKDTFVSRFARKIWLFK